MVVVQLVKNLATNPEIEDSNLAAALHLGGAGESNSKAPRRVSPGTLTEEERSVLVQISCFSQ